MDLLADTIELDCDDSYQGLPDKIRAIIRWAYAHGYDFMLKCDDDVILNPELLLNSGYNNYDYVGRANRPANKETPFVVPMGFNYWISRRCMEKLLDSPLPENSNDDEKWVAETVYRESGIKLQDDQRYRLHYGTLISRPIRVNRPLSTSPNNPIPGEFSWCIFLEGNSGNRIPLDHKLAEFKRVFCREITCIK